MYQKTNGHAIIEVKCCYKKRMHKCKGYKLIAASNEERGIEYASGASENIFEVTFHVIFISFHIFKEGGPSVVTHFEGALHLHYTYISTTKSNNYKI